MRREMATGEAAMEIGSEFSAKSANVGRNEYGELTAASRRSFLSGRTGLRFIAEELKGRASAICLPDYSCGSMVAPFVAEGFEATFYDAFDLRVAADAIADSRAEVVLAMDYFGFLAEETLGFATRCKEAGKILIVDATQTAFSRAATYESADYVVVSYRKWFDALCADVYAKDGFRAPASRETNREYVETWRAAAELKARYLKGLHGDKQAFLTMFADANRRLDDDYAGYAADVDEANAVRAVDSVALRKARRENAEFLTREVKRLAATFDVRLLFEEIGAEDCPLFVPIFIAEDKRDATRQEMIKNAVYCPVHWPIDARYPYSDASQRKKELSLICDQRYGVEDMRRQIEVLEQALTVAEAWRRLD